jgi:crotonobetainyl-CoA:carnitine CoA-transferase CaiB-like acyl-CoA transferase
MPGPLSGIRVVDMTAVLLGPTATQIMGDMGADVIKIEPPAGDATRGAGAARHPGMGSLFMHINRSKRSLVLDLKQAAGREALARLLRTADVLLHNMRPQAMARLGLSYGEVAQFNPSIVYCGAFGYGQDGRYAARPAYDDLIQSAVSLPHLFERSTGHMHYTPVNLIDRLVAMKAVYCVTSALFHRERTGEGQEIELSMFETMAEMILGEHLAGATFDPPTGPAGYGRSLSPHRRPYPTRDGHVAAMVYTDRQWQRFCQLVGRPELSTDARFVDNGARARNMDALGEIIAAELARRSTAECVALLQANDIPVMAVNTLEDLIADPHLRDVGFFQWVDHPTEGRIRSMRGGAKWSATPTEVRRHAPHRGEHSKELLRELGYSDQEIDELLACGATGEAPASGPSA